MLITSNGRGTADYGYVTIQYEKKFFPYKGCAEIIKMVYNNLPLARAQLYNYLVRFLRG